MSTRKRNNSGPRGELRSPAARPVKQTIRAEFEAEQGFVVTPLLGALLRVTHEALTQSILECLETQGVEMTETEFSVMRYPGPDKVRPIDLAQRCNMTKQAMNYVLSGFEAKGYIERRSSPGRRARTIFLTPKGWRLLAATRKCATDIEGLWAARISSRRFNALRASLYELAIWLGKLERPTDTVEKPASEKLGTRQPRNVSNGGQLRERKSL